MRPARLRSRPSPCAHPEPDAYQPARASCPCYARAPGVSGADHQSATHTSFPPALQLSAPVSLSFLCNQTAIAPRMHQTFKIFATQSRTCLASLSQLFIPTRRPSALRSWQCDAPSSRSRSTAHRRSSPAGQRHRTDTIHIPPCPSIAIATKLYFSVCCFYSFQRHTKLYFSATCAHYSASRYMYCDR